MGHLISRPNLKVEMLEWELNVTCKQLGHIFYARTTIIGGHVIFPIQWLPLLELTFYHLVQKLF